VLRVRLHRLLKASLTQWQRILHPFDAAGTVFAHDGWDVGEVVFGLYDGAADVASWVAGV
jgi:hypothetical protein